MFLVKTLVSTKTTLARYTEMHIGKTSTFTGLEYNLSLTSGI